MAHGDRLVLMRPIGDDSPGGRLRIEVDASEGAGALTEVAAEQVHPEQINNPDARHTRRRTTILLTDDEVDWAIESLIAVREHRTRGSR